MMHLGQVPGRPQGGRHGMVFAFRAAIQSSPVTVHPPSASTVAPTFIIGDYRRSPAVRFFISLSRSILVLLPSSLDATKSCHKRLFLRVIYFRIIHIYCTLDLNYWNDDQEKCSPENSPTTKAIKVDVEICTVIL